MYICVYIIHHVHTYILYNIYTHNTHIHIQIYLFSASTKTFRHASIRVVSVTASAATTYSRTVVRLML